MNKMILAIRGATLVLDTDVAIKVMCALGESTVGIMDSDYLKSEITNQYVETKFVIPADESMVSLKFISAAQYLQYCANGDARGKK